MRKIAKAVVFCIVLGLVYNYIYGIVSWKDTAGDYTSSMETLYHLDENMVDVLFLGSSHCYCSIINADLWEEHGIASMSLSISGQDIASTYHSIVETLKTQKPKVICVESYGAVFSGYAIQGNLYRNTLLYKPSLNAYEVVDDLVREQQEKKDLWLRWPIVHTRYAELQRGDFQSMQVPYLGYSAGFTTNVVEPVRWYVDEEMHPMEEENEKWFRKIIQLAEEEGIALCFFVAPYVETEEKQKIYNQLEEITKEYHVAYVNMIKLAGELEINEGQDFIDNYHTNYYGAQKVTSYMGRYLKDNYELPDRRGDTRYELWEKDVVAREHEVNNQRLLSTNDLKAYLDLVSVSKDYTVIIATSGDYLSGDADFADNLQMVGIGEEFFAKDGIWIFDNGELTYASQEKDFIYYTELRGGDLAVSSLGGTKSVIIDRANYYKRDSSINVVVYDNVLGKVVDAIGFYALNRYDAVR